MKIAVLGRCPLECGEQRRVCLDHDAAGDRTVRLRFLQARQPRFLKCSTQPSRGNRPLRWSGYQALLRYAAGS